MSNGANKPVDPERLELYQSEYYEKTDVVYRFGLVLTSSRDGAERITEEAFRLLLEDFNTVKPSTDATALLMALTWRAWIKLKSEKFHEWSQPTLQAIKNLSVDERAALYVVDMAGVEPKDAATLIGTSEKELRSVLAAARQKLVANVGKGLN